VNQFRPLPLPLRADDETIVDTHWKDKCTPNVVFVHQVMGDYVTGNVYRDGLLVEANAAIHIYSLQTSYEQVA
jgi:hypothetical protein